MEYLTALQIVFGVFLIVWVYRRGYNHALKDLRVEVENVKRERKQLSWRIEIYEHLQARAGIHIRPTLSVVTPIKKVSK